MSFKDDYHYKLLDNRWKAVSYSVKLRDYFTCDICKNTEGLLHCHHIDYTTADPWDEDCSNLITLCADCHEWVHYFQNTTGENFYSYEWVG